MTNKKEYRYFVSYAYGSDYGACGFGRVTITTPNKINATNFDEVTNVWEKELTEHNNNKTVVIINFVLLGRV